MDYESMFAVVKKQNPELSHKEAQKKASEMYQNFKKAGGNYTGTDLTGKADGSSGVSPASAAVGTVVSNELALAEKRLRMAPIDINNLRVIGAEAIPDGAVVKHGKEGVNTLVSFENAEGKRLPMVGYFRIFI